MRITLAVNASDPRPLGGAGSTRFTARGDDPQHSTKVLWVWAMGSGPSARFRSRSETTHGQPSAGGSEGKRRLASPIKTTTETQHANAHRNKQKRNKANIMHQ